jgi:hypothetical protein
LARLEPVTPIPVSGTGQALTFTHQGGRDYGLSSGAMVRHSVARS